MNAIFAGIVAAAALVFFALYLLERSLGRRSQAQARKLQKELDDLRSQPERQEFRIDRFELLWFPVVTYSSSKRHIFSVVPGLPHCRSCIQPLKLATHPSKEWSCSGCAARYPESLADLIVTDSIGKQALEYFSQRHPGFVSGEKR